LIVNTAIRKLRQALRDAPDTPAFIETVPGKGYRFIAAVEALPDAGPSLPPPAAAPLSVVGGVQAVAARADAAASGRSVALPESVVGERAAERRARWLVGVGSTHGSGPDRGAPLGVETAG
jgi:hypothetical protein